MEVQRHDGNYRLTKSNVIAHVRLPQTEMLCQNYKDIEIIAKIHYSH
jgi:hypothetical protein